MPCQELFDETDENYKQELFPLGVKVIVLEAASHLSWEKYVYNNKYLLTIDDYGASGTKSDLEYSYNYDYETLKERIIKLIK